MNVRTSPNRRGRGVRHGRDGEAALRRSRDPMHSNLCTGVCPSWGTHRLMGFVSGRNIIGYNK